MKSRISGHVKSGMGDHLEWNMQLSWLGLGWSLHDNRGSLTA